MERYYLKKGTEPHWQINSTGLYAVKHINVMYGNGEKELRCCVIVSETLWSVGIFDFMDPVFYPLAHQRSLAAQTKIVDALWRGELGIMQ